MVKLSELTEKKVKELKLSCGLIVQVKSDLTVEEQMALWLGKMAGSTAEESAEKLPELACKLIDSRDLTDSEGKIMEVNYDTFKILPISIKEMGAIMELCSTFQTEDKEKKDDGVS